MKKQNKEVSVTMRKNAAKKGIELIFTEKPVENIRAELKAAGYRWHATGEYWYAKDTAETRVLANKLAKCKITADEAKAAQPAKAKAKTKAKAEDRAIVQTGTVEIPIAKYNEMVDAMKRVKELQKQLEAIKKALA